MRRDVEPAGVEVKADGSGDRLAEDPLAINRKLAGQDLGIGLARGTHNGVEKRWKVAGQRGEHRPEPAGGRAGLVGVEERIVSTLCETDALRFAPLEADD